MNVHHLIEMANQIGRFYEAYPDRAEAMTAAAQHIRRSWDPRMRSEFLRHLDGPEASGLDPFILEAVRAHQTELTPAARPVRP